MTASTDDERNWKHPLGCLVWQMYKDLPLALGVLEIAAKPGSEAQMLGVR